MTWKRRVRRFLLLMTMGPTLTACRGADDDVVAPLTRIAVCLDNEADPASTVGASNAVDLFEPVTNPSLTPDQQWRLSLIEQEATTLEVHITRLVDDAFLLPETGRALGVRLSPSGRVVATVGNVDAYEPLEEGEPRGISWTGSLAGRTGTIDLYLTETGTAYGGVIVDPAPSHETAIYDVLSIGGGLHAMVCLDWTKFGPID